MAFYRQFNKKRQNTFWEFWIQLGMNDCCTFNPSVKINQIATSVMTIRWSVRSLLFNILISFKHTESYSTCPHNLIMNNCPLEWVLNIMTTIQKFKTELVFPVKNKETSWVMAISQVSGVTWVMCLMRRYCRDKLLHNNQLSY